MKQKMKKLLSYMLGIMLLLGLMPAVAKAEEPEQTVNFTFNVTTKVEKGSTAEAPYQVFYYQLPENAGNYGIELTKNYVETNGSGKYTQALAGTIDTSKVTSENGWRHDELTGAYSCYLVLTERNDGQNGWTYATNSYYLRIAYDKERRDLSAQIWEGRELPGTPSYTNTYTRDLNMNFIVPITKTVQQGGTVAPGTQTFTFGLKDKDGKTPADYGIELSNTSVTTNGKGDFTTNLTGVVNAGRANVANGWKQGSGTTVFCGFYLTEQNDGVDGWTYSEQTYSLVVYYDATNGASAVVSEKDSDAHTNARFVNTYTKEKAPEQPKPEEPVKPAKDQASKTQPKAQTPKTQVPRTGDHNSQAIWILLMLGSGMAVMGIVAYSRKKRA